MVSSKYVGFPWNMAQPYLDSIHFNYVCNDAPVHNYVDFRNRILSLIGLYLYYENCTDTSPFIELEDEIDFLYYEVTENLTSRNNKKVKVY